VAGLAARQRLFEAVARFLQALTRPPESSDEPVPLLLFLDDLHWADASTLDLLHYLLRQLQDAPIWVVGTYRPEEAGPDHLLTRLRQGLSRDHLVDRLTLDPLSPDAVLAIAQALVGDEDGGGLGDFLYRESEGNPFILVETVYALQEQGALTQAAGGRARWQGPPGGRLLPTSVQDVILQRVGRMSRPARRLLTLAAVMGRHFDAALLGAAARRDADSVTASLEEWLARHLVQPEPGERGRYDFSHDKIRTVVYQAAGAEERRGLHRRVGETLEQAAGPDAGAQAGLLAYHWEQAGEPGKAVPYLLQAGDQARLLYAREEAEGYYRRALAHLEAADESEQAARALMKLGLTYHNAFDFAQAREAYDQAFARWPQADPGADPAPPALAPRPLRVRWIEPTTLDPALAPDAHTDCLIAHLFSGLVELTPEMDVIPDVARAWEVSEGGRAFLFHLREDARWSDGAPVTAHDFEYAWKRTLNPATGSQAASFLYDLRGARAFHRGEGSAEDVGVRALDDFTLRVTLEQPVGYFPQLLTHVSWYPVPRHVVERAGPGWAAGAGLVSDGAFRLDVWRPGERLELVRNPGYHGRFGGNLERVILLPVQAWDERLRLYEADELDILGVTYLSAPAREEVRRRHAGEYAARPRLETHFLRFDVTRPPFDDPRVRRAFVLATDRVALADTALHGYMVPATGGLTPPGMPGHVAEMAPCYDPAQARRLLAQAGYPGGRGFPALDVLVYQAAEDRNRFLQARWREVLGVDARLEVAAWADYLARLGSGSYPLANLAWVADYPDPDDFLRVSRVRAWPAWRCDAYERLVQEARSLADPPRRMARYREAEAILAREAPILPLIYERDHLLIKPRLRSYPMSAIRPAFWKDVVMG
jgi:ABC-type oligopeptide transport system substrate-binding subunit/tetratricopeptide (TPR) repeat protein